LEEAAMLAKPIESFEDELRLARERVADHRRLEAERVARGMETDLARYLAGKEYLD
jgi:hypothetical protein